MADPRRGSCAVVAAAESDLGEVARGMTPVDLMAQALVRACAQSGVRLSDIDGIFAAATQLRSPTLSLAEYLGLDPKVDDGTNVGGSSFVFHLARACQALDAGQCEVAAIVYGSTQRSVGRTQLQITAPNPHETPFAPFLPASAYALAATRHMHQFGTTREHLASVAVAARQWALLNPAAWEKDPLTIEAVLSSRMVSTPFSIRDCCLVTDGGGALIVTRAERARDLNGSPAYVLGYGGSLSHLSISEMPDLVTTAAAVSGPRAFAMAGLEPSDIDVVQLYDAFTISPILFLEDLGFCEKGEGGRFVADGAIAPGGILPVNTNGGGLSYGHPGMFGIFTMIEAVTQLRGEAGERQVRNCNLALAHGSGGVLSSHATAILGTQASL